jgi:hypothetical protein
VKTLRRFVKVLLIALAGCILLLGSIYLYLIKLGGVERIVNKQISALLPPRYHLDVSIGDISGDFLSGIVLENVLVYYVDSTHYYLLVDIPRLSAVYSLSNLWERKYLFEYIHIDSAALTLTRDSTGHWLVPSFTSQQGSPAGTSPSFSISELWLKNASVALIERDDTLNIQRLSLVAALESLEKTLAVDLKHLELIYPRDSLVLSSASGMATYAVGNVVFKNVDAVIGDTRIKLDGNVKLRDTLSGRVDFALDNVKLPEISKFIGTSLTGTLDLNGSVGFDGRKIHGTVDAAGDFMVGRLENLFLRFRYGDKRLVLDTLYGTILGNCTIDGNGSIDFSAPMKRYRLNAEVKNFNLKQLVSNAFPSDLTGRIELVGESFKSDRLLLQLHTELHESSFDDYPLHEAYGDLVITTDSIRFVDSYRIDYFENTFYLNGRIDYRNDIDLRITADLRNLDRYQGKLFIEQPGGRGSLRAALSGLTADPDVRGVFRSDSVWLYGLYSDSLVASFDIERFLTGRKGTVEISLERGTAWGQPYDSGYTFLSIDSHLVMIDSFTISNRHADIAGSGKLDYGAYPMLLTIDSLTVSFLHQTFYNRSTILCEIDSAGFNFLQAAMKSNGAELSAEGRLNYDESMELIVEIDSVQLGPWINLFDTSLAVDGRLSCRATLNGTFLKPLFTLVGSVDSLVYRGLYLGILSAGLRYQDQLLVLDSVVIRSRAGEYRGIGSFHADLAFTSQVVERFPDLPLKIHFAAQDRNFDLVSLVMPSVEQLDGDFSANVLLTGTPHKPHLEGQAYIKNARLKYFDLAQPLFSDSAGVTMQDNRIIIDRIELYTRDERRGGRKRYAYVEGDIIVKSLDTISYDLDITLPREFPFTYELEDIRGVIEGELHIKGDSPPLVTGDLTILSMRYQANFATDETGSPIMAALAGEHTWDLNINIDILSNYWIKNNDLDAEFSGQINLIRENGVYRFIGEMEILRGKGFLFDKTFRLEPGSRVIFEGDPSINPRLDIIGYTRIAGMRRSFGDETETLEPLELGIHVTGTLNEPEINPVEGSDFSREDILPLLVANYYSSETVTSSGQIEHRLSGLISSQVSQIGARQLARLGVETFEIDHLYSGGKYDPLQARVTVGFYTAPNLYVYGRSTLAGQSRQEVGFEYRFNKAFVLEGRRDEEELYHLALKLHWEF